MNLDHDDLRVAARSQAMNKKVIYPHHSARNSTRDVNHLQIIVLDNVTHASRGMHSKEKCKANKRVMKHSNKLSETRWPLKLIPSRPLQVSMTRLSTGSVKKPLP